MNKVCHNVNDKDQMKIINVMFHYFFFRLPRRHQQDLPSPQAEIYYVEQQQHILARDPPPKPTPRKNNQNSSSYSNRHPLSLSTETILFNDDKYDPNPIVPNRAPDVPDIWLPMRFVKVYKIWPKLKPENGQKVTEKMANMMIYENLSKKQTKNPIAHEFITYSACERK